MKKLLLLTYREIIAQVYYNDLIEIFDGYFDISYYSQENFVDNGRNRQEMLSADIVLITSTECYSVFINYVNPNAEVISLIYALSKKSIDFLRSLPFHTDALLYFYKQSVTYQLTTVLYQLGVHNLHLTSFNSLPEKNTKIYDIAIVDNYSPKEEPPALKIFNIGKRYISFMTLIQLAKSVSIFDHKLEQHFFEYSKNHISTVDLMQEIYNNFSYVNLQSQLIIEHVDGAVIILNKDYQIINFNRKFLELFKVNDCTYLEYIENIKGMEELSLSVRSNKILNNELISSAELGAKLVVNKENIRRVEGQDDFYLITIKNISDITQLEISLQKKMRHQGYIAKYTFDDIIGKSVSMQNCMQKAKKVATIDKTTLILGESGCGKELFAQSIHSSSFRKKYPFVGINCAALPSQLLESELFGYVDGAFTGAKKNGKMGLFEIAHKGTIFLDEIGEMPPELQAKLLRVIEEKEIMKIGSDKLMCVDVRIIAATNRDLKELISSGKFRMDLYYRLNSIIIQIPPLRERKEDIPLLIETFKCKENYKYVKISQNVMKLLCEYPWEGNIRELRNCVEYMVHMANNNLVQIQDLPDYITLQYKSNKEPLDPNSISKVLQKYKKSEQELIRDILDTIDKKVVGRRGIYSQLLEIYPYISEYKIRQILMDLKETGLIEFGVGNCGISLKDLGVKCLNILNINKIL